jgi:hypothetical protein
MNTTPFAPVGFISVLITSILLGLTGCSTPRVQEQPHSRQLQPQQRAAIIQILAAKAGPEPVLIPEVLRR